MHDNPNSIIQTYVFDWIKIFLSPQSLLEMVRVKFLHCEAMFPLVFLLDFHFVSKYPYFECWSWGKAHWSMVSYFESWFGEHIFNYLQFMKIYKLHALAPRCKKHSGWTFLEHGKIPLALEASHTYTIGTNLNFSIG